MTVRQKLLKSFYPALMKMGKSLGLKSKVVTNEAEHKPITSFYDLKGTVNNGVQINFNRFKGQKVLIVNTASDCGYTAQYDELQKLNELYKANLTILGFPSNNFKNQEAGSDEQIAIFCYATFAIKFRLMKKSRVIKGHHQNEVYQWLTHKNKNGWNEKQPEWNFSKYLVNEEGVLTHYFGPGVSPLSNDVRKYLDKN